MGHCYSMDLRSRVVAFVEAGHSRRAAARHFGVSDSFAIKLMRRVACFGSPASARQGRAPGYGRLEPHAGVNGGLNPGQRSGVKPGQWIGHADMERAPIGALSMSARIFDQAAVISPVSGSMLSAVAWFCSALTDARRRPTDCLRR